MTYIIYKRIDRKNVFLSTTGKWIKSAAGAVCFPTESAAKEVADKHLANVRGYTFRD